MPYLDYLKPKAGRVIRASWGREVVEWVERIGFEGAIDYYGYVRKDIEPITDLALNLGSETLRFKEIHVGNVYATYNVNTQNVNADVGNFNTQVYVQGKRVIKDEDPIYIASFFAEALTQLKDVILNALSDRHVPPQPVRLAKIVDYYAPPMADIFASDIVVQFDGRVRIKMLSDVTLYAYAKFTPYDEIAAITGLLSELIPANTWKEMDFTANKNDKVNVKVDRWGRVTVIMYNIPSA